MARSVKAYANNARPLRTREEYGKQWAAFSVGAKRVASASSLLPPRRARAARRVPHPGLFQKDVRALAAAAGLSTYRPNTRDPVQFREPKTLWMAFVLAQLTHPATRARRVGQHYVIVLRHFPEASTLVLADPYPGNPALYTLDEGAFEAAWRAARKKGPPWAAILYTSQAPVTG